MARKRRGVEGPTRIGTVLGSAMPRGAPADLATWKLVVWWRRFAGRPLSDHVWPARLERGVLTLSADSSAWASEATYVRDALLARLKEEMPGLRVRAVRTVPGLARPTIAEPASETPARPASASAAAPLPRELAVALSHVADEELRSVIARAARASLAGAHDDAADGARDRDEKPKRP